MHKITSLAVLDGGEVSAFVYVFLESERRFFFFFFSIFKAAKYVCVHQSFLLTLGEVINTVTL